jgi:hypothetical protein
VPLDGAGAEEEAGSDLGIGEAVPGEPGDLALLSCEVIPGLDGPFAYPLAGGQQFAPGAFGERLHTGRQQHLVRGTELGARVGLAALAAEPLAVDEMGAGELGA